MYLASLTDEELLVHAEQTLHDLTTSDLERELIKRLQARVDLGDDKRLAVLDNAGAGADDDKDIEATFEVLSEFNCDTASSLRQKLERADKFYDLATEAGDVIERLADLAREAV